MRVPNADRAKVPESKLVHYLLSVDHHVGQGKAAFFASFGFASASWEVLESALREHVATNEVAATEARPSAVLYVVEGALTAPDGRTPRVRSVWCIDEGSTDPRLITAYPLEGTL